MKSLEPPRDTPMDYLKYYSLEHYLFSDVNAAFHERGYLTAEEFFSIVIWKANRAKGRIWNKLHKHGTDVSDVVTTLTQDIHSATGDNASPCFSTSRSGGSRSRWQAPFSPYATRNDSRFTMCGHAWSLASMTLPGGRTRSSVTSKNAFQKLTR